MPNGSGGMPDYGIDDAPSGDSWIEVGWSYVEGGIDILGDATDILETWGIIGNGGGTYSERERDRESQSVEQGWVDNAESWARDFVGTAASTQMLPWILGGLAIIVLVTLMKR